MLYYISNYFSGMNVNNKVVLTSYGDINWKLFGAIFDEVESLMKNKELFERRMPCIMSEWTSCDFFCNSPKVEFRTQTLLSGGKHCKAMVEEVCHVNCTGMNLIKLYLFLLRTVCFRQWDRH